VENTAKKRRGIYSRGSSAESPNLRFSLDTRIARVDIPQLCEGLGYIAIERGGGFYYYPDYKNDRIGAAFEWYQPYSGWKFGYKFGLEFWVDQGDLHQIGAYVLYGEDHPSHGLPPIFSVAQQRRIQKQIVKTVEMALAWRTLPQSNFFTVHYLELHTRASLKTAMQLPALDAVVLPTVILGKQNTRVSAVILRVPAYFREQAKKNGAEKFSRICALLTLALGQHHQPYKSTLGKTPLKQFVKSVEPVPSIQSVYPARKYRTPPDQEDQAAWKSLQNLAENYMALDPPARSRFDNSLFAYYTAKELLGRFPTIATVALVAALKPFRSATKCTGNLTCSVCGPMTFRHDKVGEPKAIAAELAQCFRLNIDDPRRNQLAETITHVYRTQRSSYVHEAILRHGEFGTQATDHAPDKGGAIPNRVERQNQLHTVEYLARRALLQCIADLTGRAFDEATFGIDKEKFKTTVGSFARISVGSKYWVGIRPMGRIG
jgi:hypothetical protein